ncbi:MAG TPA: type II toxin-antitoxin system MqsR family toxin [Geobacteraceae bacterium]|nr:type II toxin-antitoxin system MqsR family toxin [Geobacteraceae bacterium]
MKKKTPTYDLEELKELLSEQDTLHVTRRARKDAVSLGYPDEDSMVARILKLKRSEFAESVESKEHFEDEWQDVYKTFDNKKGIYIKLKMSFNGKGVVVSFHDLH